MNPLSHKIAHSCCCACAAAIYSGSNFGSLFGRVIFNANANNNAYRAVPQDRKAHDHLRKAHDHCEKKRRKFTRSGTYNIMFYFLFHSKYEGFPIHPLCFVDLVLFYSG